MHYKTTRMRILSFFIVILFASCASNQDVVSNRKIQKRKYQKGFFIQKKSKSHSKILKEKKTTPKPLNSKKAEFPEVSVLVDERNLAPLEIEPKTSELASEPEVVRKKILPKISSFHKKILEKRNPKIDDKTNHAAAVSFGFFILLLVDAIVIFSGFLAAAGFFGSLILGLVSISKHHRYKSGTIYGMIPLIVYAIILFVLILEGFLAAIGFGTTLPELLAVVAILFILMFLLI